MFLVDVIMNAQTLKTRHLVDMTCYDRYVIHIYHKCYAIKEERQCCVFLRIRLVANSQFYAFVWNKMSHNQWRALIMNKTNIPACTSRVLHGSVMISTSALHAVVRGSTLPGRNIFIPSMIAGTLAVIGWLNRQRSLAEMRRCGYGVTTNVL